MSLNLNKEIGKKSKPALNKKSMNLYQPDFKSDPRKMTMIGAGVALVLVLICAKFFILDGVMEIKQLKTQIQEEEILLQNMQTQVLKFGEVKEEYYKYSENFSSDEEKLVDRIEILEVLDAATKGVCTVGSTSIYGNQVSIAVTTTNMKNLSTLRTRLEDNEMVENVTVYSASGGNGTVSSSISFDCIVLEEE